MTANQSLEEFLAQNQLNAPNKEAQDRSEIREKLGLLKAVSTLVSRFTCVES